MFFFHHLKVMSKFNDSKHRKQADSFFQSRSRVKQKFSENLH